MIFLLRYKGPCTLLRRKGGLAQKVETERQGAEYESQGQVPSKARHVAPGRDMHDQIRPERPK